MKNNEISTQRHQQILAATCRCLQNKPFHALSIKEIAQEAGVAYGLVHFYFDSKNKLLTETINYVLAYFEEALLNVMTPYLNRTLSKETIFEFFEKWLELHISDEYMYYNRIWYDISAQYRFNPDNTSNSISRSTYSSTIAVPLRSILSQASSNDQIFQFLVTYLEGMALRIIVYGYDQQREIDNAMNFLRILLDGIHQA